MSGAGAAEESGSVGPIGDEAFKLFRAVTAQEEHVCTATWCPVCQLVGFVRDHPEALAAVSTSAMAFARSVRDLFDVALESREDS